MRYAGLAGLTAAAIGTLIAGAQLLALPGVGHAVTPRATATTNQATSLEVEGMTFVGSRGGLREVVLRSATASLWPERNIAELNDVSAVVTDDEEGRSVEMTCDRVELDIDSNDFLAEGDVRGETADGQRYTTAWVRYEHEKGLLFTDAPVQMVDGRGSFRGDGFRYHVHERRFELLGNVRVEQRP